VPLADATFNEEEGNPTLARLWIARDGTDNEPDVPNAEWDDNYTDGPITALMWSDDCEWLIVGYGSGVIKLWQKAKEARISVNVNKTLSRWMKRAKVMRRAKLFNCKWELEGCHLEAVNTLSLKGSLMISGSDDGTVIFHDLLETFADIEGGDLEGSPVQIAKIEQLHRGRMVNSISLSHHYDQSELLIPTAGLFLVSSGADNIVHCLSVMEILRDNLRRKKKK